MALNEVDVFKKYDFIKAVLIDAFNYSFEVENPNLTKNLYLDFMFRRINFFPRKKGVFFLNYAF
jgi:hypothetical protein